MVDRVDPPWSGGEREELDAWLDYHRSTLLLKCEGLDDAGRKTRPVATSLLSLHGLVRHMAEVERNWFRRGINGEDVAPLYYDDDQHPDGDLDEYVDTADWDTDLATFLGECDAARRIATAHEFADTFHSPRRGVDISLRWVYLHMIEEYARHNGHADLIRELVDGTTGE